MEPPPPLTMGLYVLVALGSALGGVTRFALTGVAARIWGDDFPWGTLIVNVLGSFVIGFFATLTLPGGRLPVSWEARQVFMSGVLGGFTTFSAFSHQTLGLALKGEWPRAAAYVLASVLLSLLAVAAGHLAARAFGKG